MNANEARRLTKESIKNTKQLFDIYNDINLAIKNGKYCVTIEHDLTIEQFNTLTELDGFKVKVENNKYTISWS